MSLMIYGMINLYMKNTFDVFIGIGEFQANNIPVQDFYELADVGGRFEL